VTPLTGGEGGVDAVRSDDDAALWDLIDAIAASTQAIGQRRSYANASDQAHRQKYNASA